MKRISVTVVLMFFASIILFFYQNCGQQESDLSSCTGVNCDNSSRSALSIDSAFTGQAQNGLVTVGKIASQESSQAAITYNNLDFAGNCSRGNFARHLIRWSISCFQPSDCLDVFPRSGSTTCTSNGYSISRYIRNLKPGMRHKLNIDIVGFDEFDNFIYGNTESRLQFTLNVVDTIRAPILAVNNQAITSPIIVREANFLHQGFCEFRNGSSSNNISLRARIPQSSNWTFLTSGPNNPDAICRQIETGSISALGQNWTGRFNLSFPILPGLFECQNCIRELPYRLFEVETYQQENVSNTNILLKNRQAIVFKNNNIAMGKGWTAETLYEIGLRIHKLFLFQETSITTVPDVGVLENIFKNTSVTDIDFDSNQESLSLRAYILSKMDAFEEARSPNSSNYKIFAKSNGSGFTQKIKDIATNSLSCGFPSSGNILTGSSVSDVETQRIALCFTRYFYSALHNDPATQTQKITNIGLNLSSGCNFLNGEQAPQKYCAKVRELLENSHGFSGEDIPLIANPNLQILTGITPLSATLWGIKQKYLNSTSLSQASSERLVLYTNALVQIFTNSIMSEISRHNINGVNVQNSYFMKNVLNKVYQSYFTNIDESQKLQLMNQLAPNEVNILSNGINNFSSYSTRRERGSINSTGSLVCTLSGNACD